MKLKDNTVGGAESMLLLRHGKETRGEKMARGSHEEKGKALEKKKGEYWLLPGGETQGEDQPPKEQLSGKSKRRRGLFR